MAETAGEGLARSISRALHDTSTMQIDPKLIESCLDPKSRPLDALFLAAWRHGIGSLPKSSRGGKLSGITGHLGESVAELLFDDLGYSMLWHFAGPLSGGHGADLIVLSPDARVIVVEVKATLRPGTWPRPTRREIVQLEAAWLDKHDNPGMANWHLRSNDVYAAVAVVNLARAQWRCAITANFRDVCTISNASALISLDWLDVQLR